MVLFNFITKGLNKALAPKFLRLSLRIHQSIPINAISLLPLSQRLVSIEVQDDYRQLGKPSHDGILSNASKSFDEFVDRTWNVLGLERMVERENETNGKIESDLDATNKTELRVVKERKNHKSASSNEGLSQKGHDRVQLLGKYLLPALTYTINNLPQTFVKWVRGEFLIAKYGLQVQEAIRKYPELKDDAAGLSTFDVQTIDGKEAEFPLNAILPTVQTVRRAFDMEDWSLVKLPVTSFCDEIEDSESMSIEDIIHHRLQGQVAYSGPLNAYFEMRRREDSYELWTREYIFGLANYLLQRIDEMNSVLSDDVDTTILDVGAGDGRLIYFLRRAMTEIESSKTRTQIRKKGSKLKSCIPTFIATDDGSWRAPIYKTSHIQVEQLSAEQAVEKYAPNPNETNKRLIVICSWMPPGEDWTYLFRRPARIEELSPHAENEFENSIQKNTGLVEEYILIGECDDGTCGHNWYTWGNRDFDSNNNANDEIEKVPPYTEDGYIRVDMEELSELQFSRFDCKRSSESRTVSFRRNSFDSIAK
jgi:hypothetical protein